jgi:hypothetical protein
MFEISLPPRRHSQMRFPRRDYFVNEAINIWKLDLFARIFVSHARTSAEREAAHCAARGCFIGSSAALIIDKVHYREWHPFVANAIHGR